MRPLTPLDSAFLTGETREMPMHVGSLLLFRPPSGASKGYLADVYRECVSVPEFRAPFNEKLVHPPSRLGLPHWDRDPDFDPEYHLRLSALPTPQRYRELFVLISRLHGTLLDRSRPLWEYHLIEGLESGQFAMYTKMHHALLDGIAGMRLLQSSLSEDPNARLPFALAKQAERKRPEAPKKESADLDFARVVDLLQTQLGTIPGVAKALRHAVESWGRPREERMAFPFEAPRSPLNPRITGARRFVAQSYSLERIDAVRKAFDATINDIVLAMCASALRRYLIEHASGVPERPLTAMTPVSVRPRDGDDFGNAVTAVLVSLGTNIEDPKKRFDAIRASMADAKGLIRELSYAEVMLFTLLTASPVMLPMALGLTAKMPAVNIVISNVPGPRKTLYWNGARLEGMYPVSIVAHGMAVNITVTSYAGSLDFGIVGCRKSVPRIQRLIDFLEDGLVELEELAGLASSKVRTPASVTAS